jgi:hypothetical protein
VKKYGFSFSWKRALGISAFKSRLSRQIGIPLTRSGRQRKVGRALGCCVVIAALVAPLALLITLPSAFGYRSLFPKTSSVKLDESPNQSMKPTAPLQSKSSVLARTPCRGSSLSR